MQENHENVVVLAGPQFLEQGAEMVLEAISPVVEGISSQFSALGEHVNIMGRVGQSAENCSHLYEQRLIKLEKEHQDLYSCISQCEERI